MANMIKLTPSERDSELWKKISKILNDRLDQHRRQNDSDQDDSKTAKLRGRIAEVKFLLALDRDPDPAIPSDAGE